ncbi:DUF4031 domain-containing protein [Brachybacterium sp. GPGPB12]|uniref:DUF4031 domain-containing protein n=1 Tax=Brachybacterium sp. GPGPB12 TaxID=3023517 RepID=UPI00313431AB
MPLAIGLAHAILLFSGDILVGYAVIGMLCALLMTRGRVSLAAAAIVTLPALGVWGWVDGTVGLGGGTGYASASAPDYLAGVGIRAPDALHGLSLAPIEEIGLLSPMALGALMARGALLEDVPAHRGRLGRLARWGLAIGLVGAVPLAAVLVLDPAHTRLDAEIVLGILGVLHQVSGLAGAVGLAAGAAPLAARWDPRPAARAPGADGGPADATATPTPPATPTATDPPPVGARGPLGAAVRAVEALGAVSLSAYLAQSVLCLLLFPPYTLDLGARSAAAGAAALVLAGWLLMLLPAVPLRRSGRRGPMEHVRALWQDRAHPAHPAPPTPTEPAEEPDDRLRRHPRWPRHGTVWGHLVSDRSLEEPHEAAARAGLPPRAFDLDHYDWPASAREDLEAAGVSFVGDRELTRILLRSGRG